VTDKTISVALRPRLQLAIGLPLLELDPVHRSRTVATIIHAHAGRIDLKQLARDLPVLERLEWQLNFEHQEAKGAVVDSRALTQAMKILHALYCP
jgi:hypothetical protein